MLINYILFMLIALVAAGCSQNTSALYKLPFYRSADLTPVWLAEGDPQLDTMHAVKDFSFTDHQGKVITAKDFKGKIYITNFFFTSCPGICPVMTKNLLPVQAKYKNDEGVMFISHTVSPETDSLKQLKAYAESYGIINDKWHLVTGNKKDLYETAWYSYLVDEEPGFSADSTQFIHTEHVLLIDPHRRIRGVYNGTLQLEMERMMGDIEELKKE